MTGPLLWANPLKSGGHRELIPVEIVDAQVLPKDSIAQPKEFSAIALGDVRAGSHVRVLRIDFQWFIISGETPEGGQWWSIPGELSQMRQG